MFGAAQYVEQPHGKTNSRPDKPDRIGRTIARRWNDRGQTLGIVPYPIPAPVGYTDLGVGKPIGFDGRLASVIPRCCGGPRHYVGADGPPFAVIAIEQGRRRYPLYDEGELPGEVIGILNTCIHTLAAGRRMNMCRVSREEDTALPITLSQPHTDTEDRRPVHIR